MIDQILVLLFAFMIGLYLSWIALFFLPRKKENQSSSYPDLSIIIPAHNEEASIKESIRHALLADYPGKREVIVINDGSLDETGRLVREMAASDERVKVLDQSHSGKATAINNGAEQASGEILVVVDADSKLAKDALTEMVRYFADERVGAVSGVIRAEMNNNPLTWFQDIEYMMSSTWRSVCNKINGTYLLPGFTAFRKTALKGVCGFGTDTLCEDFDIGLRMKKAGYKMMMSGAVMYTRVPQDLSSLIRQRIRWSRGTLQVVRKHSDVPFNTKYGAVGLYGVPTQMYWFFHGSLSLPITIYQITYGYYAYFAQYQDYFSANVAGYFFNWFTLYGMFDYSLKTFTGVYPVTLVFVFCFISFVLGTLYMILSILRHSRLDARHMIAVFFFSPYSLFSLIVFMVPLVPEIVQAASGVRGQNIWTK